MAALGAHLLPPALLALLLAFSLSADSCDTGDTLALLKIKAAFSNPPILSSWTNSTNCCNWYGLTCGPTNTTDRVTTLSLFNTRGPLHGLSGPLPDALGHLPFLKSLVISNHPLIVGNLPSTLTRLPALASLDLRRNSLSGPIPPFLSQIHALNFLDLSSNKFSGVIPPELGALPVLYNLNLAVNSLVGNIPAAFRTFGSPMNLNVSYNMLSGEIPGELDFGKWVALDLSHNNLSGEANLLFGANNDLRYLDMSFNRFTFDLTPVSFPVKLNVLYLNDNSITGSIPAQINQVTHLGKFNVRNNELCGVIPAGPVMDRFDDSIFLGNKCLYKF